MAIQKLSMPSVFEVKAYGGGFAVYQTVVWSTGNTKQVIRFTGTERQCKTTGKKLTKSAEKAKAQMQKTQVVFAL